MERDITRHAPPSVIADIGRVNIFSLASQKPNRPGNFGITRGAIIDYLCVKGEVDIGKALWIGKYTRAKAPTYPTRIKLDEGATVDEADEAERDFEGKKAMYGIESKMYVSRKERFEREKYHACEVIIAQCTDALKDRLKTENTYETIEEESNANSLLKLVEACCHGNSGRGYFLKNAVLDLKDLMDCEQKPRELNRNYGERLEAAIMRAEMVGIDSEELLKFPDTKKLGSLTDEQKGNRVKAMLLVNSACPNRYSGYKDWLHHRAVAGDDTYPKDWIAAMTRLDEYKTRVSLLPTGQR